MRKDKHVPNDMNLQSAADLYDAVASSEGNTTAEEPEALDVRAALVQCQQELQEAKNAILRAHADFDNFRKRMRAERDQEFNRGSERVLTDLLPIVDDFDRALAAVNDQSTVESLTQGIQLIYRQLLSFLQKNNITPMEVLGKPFDPKYHDAIARVATDEHPEHTIIGEIQRGYTKNEETFRPAKVAVSVTPEEE